MAVVFPAGIYSEGQGIFNAMPYARMIEARKKAKDEAFTKYYDKLQASINPAGVRDVDYPFITKEIEDLQKYGIQNQSAISKGGAEKLQFEKMVRNASQRINQSKNAGKFEMELGKAYFEKKYDPTDDDLEIQRRAALSIYDPKFYKEYYINEAQGLPEYTQNTGTMWSFNDVSPAVPVLKVDEKKKIYDFAIQNKKPQPVDPKIIPLEKIGNQNFVTYKYTDKDLKESADIVMAQIKPKPIDFEGRRLKKTYQSHMDDPNWMASRDPIFQKYYNRPIENVADAAAADFLFDKSSFKEQKAQAIPRPPAARIGRKGGADGFAYDYWSDLNKVLTDRKTKFGTKDVLTSELPQSLYTVISATLTDAKKQGVDPSETFIAEKDGRLGLFKTQPAKKLGMGYSTKGMMIADDASRIVWLDELGFNTLGNQSEKSKTIIKQKAAAQQKPLGGRLY